jgi:TPR repeat protein
MHWHYSKVGLSSGPVDSDTLSRMILSGELTAGDLVWRDPWSEWRELGAVEEFSSVFQRSRPGPPPLPGSNSSGAFIDEPSPPLPQLLGSSGAFDFERCFRCGGTLRNATIAYWHIAGVCKYADFLEAKGWAANKIRRYDVPELSPLDGEALEAILAERVGMKSGHLVENEEGLLEEAPGGYHFNNGFGNGFGEHFVDLYDLKALGSRIQYLRRWRDIAEFLYNQAGPYYSGYRETEESRQLLSYVFSLFQALAVEQVPGAAWWVGYLTINGYGVTIDYEMAAKVFRWIYQNCSPDDTETQAVEAATFLAQILNFKLGRPEEGFRVNEAMASRDPRAAFRAGAYLWDHNLNRPRAMEFFRQAAAKGNAEAYTMLGRALMVQEEVGEALNWFEKAANESSYRYPKGNPWGLYWQAIIYKDGIGVPADRAKAVALLDESVTRPGADYETPDPELVKSVETLRAEMRETPVGSGTSSKILKFFEKALNEIADGL